MTSDVPWVARDGLGVNGMSGVDGPAHLGGSKHRVLKGTADSGL